MMPSNATRKYFLLTHPRTASNLLIKILALQDQPSLVPSKKRDYFFLPSLGLNFETVGKPLTEWSPEQKEALRHSNQKCFEALNEHVSAAEAAGKDVYVKEHLAWMIEPVARERFTLGSDDSISDQDRRESWAVKALPEQTYSISNEIVLPDEVLRSWLPTFLIRHPALVFPSIFRTCVDLEGHEEAKAQAKGPHLLEMTMHWSRTLYDWYLQQERGDTTRATDGRSRGDVWPVVLDADDIILHPEIVRKYSEMVGLDPTKLKFSWKEASDEELGKLNFFEKRMLSTISASSSVLHDKAAGLNLNIDEEYEKWKTEFDQEDADKLKTWVEVAMPDYEYMRERRLQL